MKTRNGFVSNSSSSSFVIPKCYITPFQIALIKNHFEASSFFCSIIQDEKYYSQGERHPSDEWEIRETDKELMGFTTMDNFGMDDFLALIGVNIRCGSAFWSPPWEEKKDE